MERDIKPQECKRIATSDMPLDYNCGQSISAKEFYWHELTDEVYVLARKYTLNGTLIYKTFQKQYDEADKPLTLAKFTEVAKDSEHIIML